MNQQLRDGLTDILFAYTENGRTEKDAIAMIDQLYIDYFLGIPAMQNEHISANDAPVDIHMKDGRNQLRQTIRNTLKGGSDVVL